MGEERPAPRREDLLTTAEVARRLGVAPRTVGNWIQSGRLKPTLTTMGGHARFLWEDVEDQVEAAEQARDDR
ncbi:MAG: helix-turn-helix domain-containing protein [Pseudonocardiales bacterium]|nr:helix-turn-helix domain-containing protein [Pseudonocardiales bacterium]